MLSSWMHIFDFKITFSDQVRLQTKVNKREKLLLKKVKEFKTKKKHAICMCTLTN
jgi:hypothetical protein